MYYLGVDSGGTKTKFALINDRFQVCSVTETTTGHVFQVGKEGIMKVLQEGLDRVIQLAGIRRADIEFAVLGMPGYTEVKENDLEIEEAVFKVFQGIKYYIGNDVEVGWAGALACQCGVNIVAGTGSIAYALDVNGMSHRIGGWGDFIGDEGSAHWIGKKVLEVYSKQKDGRLPKTVLMDIVEKEYGILEEFEMIDIIHNRYKLDRAKVARFSMCAYLAANEGCEAAIRIFEAAAYELYLHIQGILQKAIFDENIPISYVGGVFKSKDYILKPFKAYLDKLNRNVTLVEPIMEPCYGAGLYALLRARNKQVNNDMIRYLLEGIKRYES